MEHETESHDSILRDLALRIRAIAYLMEAHNSEILPILDMEDAWQIVGQIFDDLGSKVLDVARVIERESFKDTRRKRR